MYLSAHVAHPAADSPNELADLDPGKAYIIGGIVNRHKTMGAGKAVCLLRVHLSAHVLHAAADSPNELADLDPGKAYIIGGIVDRNRHKNLCAGKAAEQGIATARLPVSHFFKLSASAVLTVNQARRQPVRARAVPGSLCVAPSWCGC